MPSSSNASFIPKYNNTHKEHRGPRRQVYVGTLLVRILFFAVLVAAVFVFFYSEHLQGALEQEVVTLDTQIKNFNTAELERVVSVDARLAQATHIHTQSVSMVTLLSALEASLAESVYLSELAMARQKSGVLEVVARVITKSFDGALFQQGVYEENTLFGGIAIAKLTQEQIAVGEEEGAPVEPVVSFEVTMQVDEEALRDAGVVSITEPILTTSSEVLEEPSVESGLEEGGDEDVAPTEGDGEVVTEDIL